MNRSWDTNIPLIIEMVKKYETMPPVALSAKLAEETGEFCEVMLYENGFLRHKTKEFETPFTEAADIINVIIGALCMQYPDLTTEQTNEKLLAAFDTKGAKYARLIARP